MAEDYKRSDPEEVLRQIKQAEQLPEQSNRGRLKIFLGYCAGVGKTYRMLQDGATSKLNHVDVVIGIVETHGRKETESLVAGLEIIPRKKIEYSGIFLEEMDIDQILKRAPRLVLVDELAHTNVAGSRHTKRYQDVEELLYAGIDVFTTLNIQHVESQIDVVGQISGIKVYETVPDTLLELADEVELVDLTPEKLLERMKEGNVYIPDKAKVAMQKFFRKGNLIALRELSLRYTAKHVDEDMQTYREKSGTAGPWSVGSRLLVSISGSPNSGKLLRIANRMASEMDAEWYAVYVNSPQQITMDERSRTQLEKNIRLAEDLGAKVVPLSGDIIADEIVKFAKQKNVTLIIAGLSHRSKLDEILKGSVINELVKKSNPINVLIVGHEHSTDYIKKSLYEKYKTSNKKEYKPYLASIMMIGLTLSVCWPLTNWLGQANVGMLLLLPVIASSLIWGTTVGIFASIMAIASYDFFLIPPYLTFNISNFRYLPGFIVFIAVAVINGILAKSLRWQYERSTNRERFVEALYSFSKELMKENTKKEVASRAAMNISDAFGCNTVIFMSDQDRMTVSAQGGGSPIISESDVAIATWVYKNVQPAGRNTNTLASSTWYFLPLMVREIPVGVIAIQNERSEFITSEQNRLLESFASMIALAMASHSR